MSQQLESISTFTMSGWCCSNFTSLNNASKRRIAACWCADVDMFAINSTIPLQRAPRFPLILLAAPRMPSFDHARPHSCTLSLEIQLDFYSLLGRRSPKRERRIRRKEELLIFPRNRENLETRLESIVELTLSSFNSRHEGYIYESRCKRSRSFPLGHETAHTVPELLTVVPLGNAMVTLHGNACAA